MRRFVLGLFIILICVVVVLGCRKKDEGMDPASPGTSPEESGALNKTGENIAVAVVNGKSIGRQEVDRNTERFLTQYQGRIPPEKVEEMRSGMWERTLESMIDQTLLLQEAGKEKIQTDEKAVDERLAEIYKSFPSKEEFMALLAKMGVSEKELRKEASENMIIEALLEKKFSDLKKVTDEDIQAFYRDNPQGFKKQERVQARHILLKSEPDDSEEVRAQKRKKLEGLRKEIEQGAVFAELAGEHSDCPSKTKGGSLGYFEKGKMAKAFEEAAFKLKPGELSGIVETQFGYHLIEVDDHQEAQTVPLEQAKDKIAMYLNNQQRDKAVNDYVVKLREGAKIEYADGVKTNEGVKTN